MGLKDCSIIFDNQFKTYYVGQTVTGRVELSLDSPKKVRGVIIKFKGESLVKWHTMERHTVDGKTESRTVYYEGNEEYFRIQFHCIGAPGGDTIELAPGTSVFPFTCVLPPTLPSSFEGKYGYIRYTVKVVLDRPWKFDQETKAAFTVLSPFDLNTSPGLRVPARVTLEKYFCCCCCRSGPLTCIVSVNKTGFVPGEPIPVIAEIDNISDKAASLRFKLQKVESYYSQTPRRDTKRETTDLLELKLGPVEPHGSKTWNQLMVVPSLPPSNLVNCSLIDVDYELIVELCVPGFHMNEEGNIPITIGTVPLANIIAPSAPQLTPYADVRLNTPAEGYNQDTPLLGWAVPPAPTFGESTFGTGSIYDKEDNEHTKYSGNVPEYRPMYPIYNFDKVVNQ